MGVQIINGENDVFYCGINGKQTNDYAKPSRCNLAGGTVDFSSVRSVWALFIVGQLAFFLAWYLFSWNGRNAERRGHPVLVLLALLPFALGIIVL